MPVGRLPDSINVPVSVRLAMAVTVQVRHPAQCLSPPPERAVDPRTTILNEQRQCADTDDCPEAWLHPFDGPPGVITAPPIHDHGEHCCRDKAKTNRSPIPYFYLGSHIRRLSLFSSYTRPTA